MSVISVTYSGNGVAYAVPSVVNGGETVTLTCTPDPGETLIDIVAYDEHGYSVALSVVTVQTFTYNATLGNVFITVTFSSTTPPGPGPGRVGPWLYKKIADANRCLKF